MRVLQRPPASSKEFTDEVEDYIIRCYLCYQTKPNHKKSAKAQTAATTQRRQQAADSYDVRQDAAYGDNANQTLDDLTCDIGGARGRNVQELRRAWSEFRKVFNCMPLIAHAHEDAACCGYHSDATMRARMTAATVDFCWSALPWVPQSGKWTKSGPAVDYFVRVLVALPLLSAIWTLAFGKTTQKEMPQDANLGEEDQAWLEMTSFHKVGSKRINRGGKMFDDPSAPEAIMILGILLEPLRWLTGWSLHYGAEQTRARQCCWGKPPLGRLLEPSASPVARVLQYFAEVLQGKTHRTRLLWLRSGHRNFFEWAAASPCLHLALRRGVVAASAWTHHRMFLELTFPWRLALTVYPEFSDQAQLAVCHELVDTPQGTNSTTISATNFSEYWRTLW